MPPLSVTSRWSCIRSITGCGVVGVELGRVGAGQAEHVAGELDRHRLQAEADAEARHVVLAGVAGGGDLALDAALRRSRRGSPCRRGRASRPAASSPSTSSAWIQSISTLAPWWKPACLQALDDRQVGVGQARRTCRSGRSSPGVVACLDLGDDLLPRRRGRPARRCAAPRTPTSSRPSSCRISGSS